MGALYLRRFFPLFALLSALASLPTPMRGAALPSAADAFASEPYVIQSFSSISSMNADGTGERVQSVSLKIQSEAALHEFGIVSLAFASQSGSADFLYVRVLRPDGTVLPTPLADAVDQPAPVTLAAPLYSDIKIKQLPIKNLRIGDTLQWQARFTTTHPEIPGQFWGLEAFTHGAVVLDEVHELRVPATVHPTVWTNPEDASSLSESNENNQHIYRWRHAELKPTVGPQADTARLAEQTRLLTPGQELDAIKGKLPSIAWTTFHDWSSVGAWYSALSANRTAPDAAIQAKVAELTAGKSTELAKAQAIYNYVSTQIRYIGVDFGIGRYQPHSAAEVFANQFGDCKDKHTLLASMLAAVGLHADPVLIGAGIRFNAAVPSPGSFNHLITRLTLDGNDVWLDATAEAAPWRALSAPIRDQDALVIPSSSTSSIVRTPADLPYPAYATSVVTGSLDQTLTSDSKVVMTFRDDDEIYLRAALQTVSPANYGVFIQQLMENLGFGGTTSEPAFQHLEDSSQPLVVSFRYHRVKETNWGQNRITAIFAPVQLPAFSPQNPPISTILLGVPRTQTSTIEMTLPDGWSAELPEAVHAHSPFATCDVSYRVQSGKLFADRRLAVLQSKVPVADSKQYQAWYDSAGVSGVPFIQLVAPVGPANLTLASKQEEPQPAKAPQTTASDPLAADLVLKANESIRSMDPDAARKLLDQAKAINPGERGLWMGYGAIDSQMGRPAEALQDLREELAHNPDEVKIYHYLAMQKLTTGDQQGAITSLREWVKASPADPDAAAALVQQLNASKQYAEALTAAEAALARIGSTSADLIPLRLALANAQMQLGHTQEAATLLGPMLQSASDPALINYIAYQLADAGLNLPEDDTAERHALALLEAESATWSLAEAPVVVMRKQMLLGAAWDTMGWILYKEGKSAEALSYAEAACETSVSATRREHLSAIAANLHDATAAAFARKTDQQFRTLRLGGAKGRHGTVELRMLIADGKAVSLAPPATNLYAAPPSSDFTPPATLPGLVDLVKSANLQPLLPTGSAARLVRSGFIDCHGTDCDLVLSPLGATEH